MTDGNYQTIYQISGANYHTRLTHDVTFSGGVASYTIPENLIETTYVFDTLTA